MKKLFTAFAVAALFAPAAVRADDKDTSSKTIAEIAMANPDFSTLVTALKAADLADVLNGEGTFTVFAPTNAAFEKIGKGKLDAILADKTKLKAILMAHVIKDKKVTAADVKGMEGKKLPCGHTVKCEGEKCMLVRGSETIKVTKADIMAKNGIVHVIDTVIVPDSVISGNSDR